jgi:hypothetical protein
MGWVAEAVQEGAAPPPLILRLDHHAKLPVGPRFSCALGRASVEGLRRQLVGTSCLRLSADSISCQGVVKRRIPLVARLVAPSLRTLAQPAVALQARLTRECWCTLLPALLSIDVPHLRLARRSDRCERWTAPTHPEDSTATWRAPRPTTDSAVRTPAADQVHFSSGADLS